MESLQSKLNDINEQEEQDEKKKEEFEKKRKQHYKNEFQMAQAMKNRTSDSDE